MKKEKALVVLSGGQDSTTCLYWALAQGYDVQCVTFDYGQRHKIEIDAARLIAEKAGVTTEVIELGPILAGTSPLVSSNELDQYSDMNSLPGGLEKTFVPYRNQLFLTVAANRAYVAGINVLVTGVCQEDFGGYPDCRRSFIDSLQQACTRGSHNGVDGAPGPLRIETPLMFLTKAASVKLAASLAPAPNGSTCWDALAYSHTAYDGKYPPTGHDHATLLRAKGFFEAGLPDPLVLRAVEEGVMDAPGTANYDFLRIVAKEAAAS
jgi:7-cyano-7-deazaguanine synthase